MARAYWRTKGQASKTRLIGREKGYHGVNFGGISVGGMVGNRKHFGQSVEADHLPHTQLKKNAFSRGMPAQGAELADELLNLIALHDASNIAAVIVEPFSGSAGVVIPPVGYLQRLREICTANNILLIFDEVITGFGRAGAWTGSEAFGVTPDILNIAKQVTNGVQPLGAVVAKQEIYDTFMAAGGPDYMLEFPHGYTYSAHPVACAAGLATLDLLEKEDMWAACAPWRRTSSGRAQPQGREARGRHPQLRAGRRFYRRGPARRAGQAPLPDRHGHAEEGLLRALRRRHHPARAALRLREGRDRPARQRAGRELQRLRVRRHDRS
jgi:adenosylmethionine-8-amino-7-oxononanoate aminotransferase